MAITARLAVGTALIAALGEGGAWAQAPSAPPAPTTLATAEPGDIVVTAQRREERLQDVPLSVSAFSGTQLQALGVRSTRDLQLVNPSLTFAQSSYSPQPTIRGIGTRGVGANDESVVPVYVDGVYQPVLTSLLTDFNDVERVEVLRGPQGALFGRNSTGGAINIITVEPRPELDGRFSVSYGRFDERIIKGYVSGGTDLVQTELAALYHQDSGYLRSAVDPSGHKEGRTDNVSVHGKVRLTPNDTVEVILAGGHQHNRDTLTAYQHPLNGQSAVRRLFPAQYVTVGDYQYASTPGLTRPTVGDLDNASATEKLHFDRIDLTAISGYSKYRLTAAVDSDGEPPPYVLFPLTNFSRSFIQELYASTTGSGPFQLIVGGTYFWQSAGTDYQVTTNGKPSINTRGVQRTNSYAAYAQASYNITDKLSIVAAGRYTTEHKDFNVLNRLLATNNRINAKAKFNDFSPSGTIKYAFTPDANIYVRAAHGFKSGLFPVGTFADTPVQPEKVWQYEAGAKVAVGHWLHANIAGYYSTYKDQQVNIRIGSLSTLQNAASSRIYGVEGDLTITPVRDLNLFVSGTRLSARYETYRNASGTALVLNAAGQPAGGAANIVFDASGRILPRVPLFSVSTGFNYRYTIGDGDAVLLSSNYNHVGKTFRDADHRVQTPRRNSLNAEIGYRLARYGSTVSLFGLNLLNDTYPVYILTGTTADSVLYEKPRSYGIRLDFEI